MLFTDGSVKILMYIPNDAISLISFAFYGLKTEDARLRVGRQDRNAQLSIVHQLYS